jgi:hypothetical protein
MIRPFRFSKVFQSLKTKSKPKMAKNYTEQELNSYLRKVDSKYIPNKPNPTSLTSSWDTPPPRDPTFPPLL